MEYTVEYYKSYKGSYTVEANSKEEAEAIVKQDILEGRRNGPDTCYDSGFIREKLTNEQKFDKCQEKLKKYYKRMDEILEEFHSARAYSDPAYVVQLNAEFKNVENKASCQEALLDYFNTKLFLEKNDGWKEEEEEEMSL